MILIDRFFPSSKTCSACGYINDDLTLNDRTWTCPDCGTEHDRDVNAAINIKNEGMRILKEKNIKVIFNDDTTVGATGLASGENVRLANQLLLITQLFSMKEESISL